MERKIGEIFEYNGEWYQCVKSANCNECAFLNNNCAYNPNFKCSADDRKDNCSVIFKKLEKVGEPYRRWLSPFNNIMVQRYRLYGRNVIMPDEPIMLLEPNYKNSVEIEIKQTKEDMEEYRMYDAKEDIPEFDKVVDECLFGEDKLNLKTFDLEAAKLGKPVCTRDGRKARIICYDRQSDHGFPLVVLVENTGAEKDEDVHFYRANGTAATAERAQDLMMLSEKKEGWVNLYKSDNSNLAAFLGSVYVYNTKEEALNNASPNRTIATVKIEWEE